MALDLDQSKSAPAPVERALIQQRSRYHWASTIVEKVNTAVGRTTTRTFDDDFTPYLLNQPSTETVTVGSESFTKSWGHDQAPGFLESETIYGVTPQFTFDGDGNRATTTDANSHTTSFTYQCRRRTTCLHAYCEHDRWRA